MITIASIDGYPAEPGRPTKRAGRPLKPVINETSNYMEELQPATVLDSISNNL